jgi:TPR repeat protein
MGGSGKKARAKASKAKKKTGGEAATPPAPPAAAVPSTSVQRSEEESTYGAEWFAREEEGLGALKAALPRHQAGLASTEDLVDRERGVKKVLSVMAGAALAPVKGPEAYRAAAATAFAERKRLWEVAAHAATFAVTAAAAAASTRTPAAARAKVKGVAQTAALAAVAAATAAFDGSAACCEGLIVAARAAAAEELEQERQPTAAGASGSGGGKTSTGITAVPATDTAPPPSSTSSAQTVVTREGRAAAATAAVVSEEATTAPPHASDRAALVSRLCTFAESTAIVMYTGMKAWVESKFSGDWAAVAAVAEGGNAKAQYFMAVLAPQISKDERTGWMASATDQDCPEVILAHTLATIASSFERGGVSTLESEKDEVMNLLELPLESDSAPAQYVAGMLHYIFDCDSGAQEDFLDAARWIRKAAKQKVAEAQYELGEMFRRGLFCDVHNMRFAREYLQRAARQGHAEAVERMKELRSCAFCGAADAPWKCGFCRQAMYCDYATCCVKHWREGGGVGGGIIMDAGARHKKVCPRTHAAPDDESDDEEDDVEE